MGHNRVSLVRNEIFDASGRMRTAHPTTVFDFDLQYNKQTKYQWFETPTGSATFTHAPTNSGVNLNVTSASGDKATRSSMRYFRYQKGKSERVEFTFVLAAAHANCRQRVGLFTSNNGVFFAMVGTTPTWVLRSDVSGSVVERAIPQAEWTKDPMLTANNRGNGVFDATKIQLAVIDLKWLSAGIVRCGFEIDGKVVYVHEFKNANRLSTAYMRTANLPLTFEIENVGVTDGSKTLLQICGTVISEGGFDTEAGYTTGACNSTSITGISTTLVPLVSIRPRTLFNLITNRAHVELIDAMVTASAACVWKVLFNATLTGSPSWNSVSTDDSTVEFDIAATGLTGGNVLYNGLGGDAGTRTLTFRDLKSRIPFCLTADGSAAYTTITLAVAAQTGTGMSAFGAINWREVY